MRRLFWRNGFGCADKRADEVVRSLGQSLVVDDRFDGDVRRDRNGSGQALGDVVVGFAASRGEALRQDMRRCGDFDDACRVAFRGMGNDAAGYICDDGTAGREIVGEVVGNAVVQAVGLPLQRKGSGGEFGLGDRFMILAAGVVGAGDNPANEADPRIVSEGCAGKTEQRVFAGTAGSDNQNKHI